MQKYDHKKIEKKCQKYWKDKKIYKTKEGGKKSKCYVLDMFPYLSGEGLHVGHPRGYIATDVYSRFKRMNGFNVLHPIGFDSFGLPAENYAIKNKIHPEIAVKNNIKKFKGQLGLIGFDYDWEREIITSDPNFYRWTQWIFLKMFEKGLAYESYEPINFCPSCLTGLANEDVEDGRCERCATSVVKKPMRQWVLKITDYAERLLEDLGELKDWPEHIKESQRNWIGKSEGTEVSFKLIADSLQLGEIRIFTTRIDTIFGVTYVVLAPENKIISNLESRILNPEEVNKYIKEAKNKSDLQRTDLAKEKTGVELKGVKAVNPFNNEEVPIWVADYVLGGYGTGAVMAVPAHDERDWKFAKRYNLKINRVIQPLAISTETKFNINQEILSKEISSKIKKLESMEEIYTGMDGTLINSGEYTKMNTFEAREKMTKWLEEKNLGGKKVNYKLKDWVFSRQRYWGEPIPLIHCENCKTKKALLIHGFEGNGNGHWFLWLKKKLEERGIKVYNPTISTANHPTVESWLKELTPIVKDFGPDDIVVGHSLGSNAALQLAEKLNKNIGNFFLLASAIGRPRSKEFWSEIENSSSKSDIISLRKFWESKIDYKKIAITATSVTIIRSADDSLIPKDAHENLPSAFAQEEWEGYGHFTDSAEIPKLWERIEKIISHGVIPVPEKDLPVKLPKVKFYEPADTGESPLVKIEKWVNVKCPKCGGKGKRETNTMPQWAGSSWYYLRYIDPKNKKALVDNKKEKYWMGTSLPSRSSPSEGGVDMYVGGAEHATRHLIYARFWHKFLFDIGIVGNKEPFSSLRSQGLITGSDGRKMSKRWGNVVNPDDVVGQFGADTLRIYEMFMGPFDQPISWSTDNMVGSRRFLERVWKLESKVTKSIKSRENSKFERLIHQTIKKTTEDIENFRFNTAISSLMILLNEMEKSDSLEAENYKILIKLLSPFAPHITDEIWSELGGRKSIHLERWPEYDESKLESEETTIVVQINGKVRASFKVEKNKNQKEIESIALSLPEVKKHLAESEIKKIFFVKDKIISIVI